MESSGWHPKLDDLLYDDATQIGHTFEDTISSGSTSNCGRIDRLELATRIEKENKIGVLLMKEEISDNRRAEFEITRLLRMTGIQGGDHTLKMRKSKLLLAGSHMQVSGVKNLYVDDNFFKLTTQPSAPFQKMQKPMKKGKILKKSGVIFNSSTKNTTLPT